MLVATFNRQIETMSAEFSRRRAAEDRLTDHLNQLENIVSARTNELKASNMRLRQSNEELQIARSTALDMAHARSAFLAHMSHEIRTPLNGLLGMLALSLDSPLGAEQRQQLMIAHDSGKVLVELLNDILDMSKFDAGHLEIERIPFDLGALIEDTANLLSQNAAPSVELTCLIAPDFPALVTGDPTRVRQNRVRIEVRDTGIGIAQDAQAKIFQPFTQAEAAITRQYGGTGLGLALTNNLCEAMNGQLSIQSQSGFGSQFCAELPLPINLTAVTVISSAGSGLVELLGNLLPFWGVDLKRRSIDDRPDDLDLDSGPDLVITDCPECLFAIRPTTPVPILLNFMPAEQVAALAPLQQQARPLARNALYHTLRRVLNQEEPGSRDPMALEHTTQHQARVLLVEDNPVNQLVAKAFSANSAVKW